MQTSANINTNISIKKTTKMKKKTMTFNILTNTSFILHKINMQMSQIPDRITSSQTSRQDTELEEEEEEEEEREKTTCNRRSFPSGQTQAWFSPCVRH